MASIRELLEQISEGLALEDSKQTQPTEPDEPLVRKATRSESSSDYSTRISESRSVDQALGVEETLQGLVNFLNVNKTAGNNWELKSVSGSFTDTSREGDDSAGNPAYWQSTQFGYEGHLLVRKTEPYHLVVRPGLGTDYIDADYIFVGRIGIKDEHGFWHPDPERININQGYSHYRKLELDDVVASYPRTSDEKGRPMPHGEERFLATGLRSRRSESGLVSQMRENFARTMANFASRNIPDFPRRARR